MKKSNFLKMSLLAVAIIGLACSFAHAQALPIFRVSQNDLSKEVMAQLLPKIATSEITVLSLTKNNKDKDIYSVAYSPAEDTKIIILNEQTGSHVAITPVNKLLTEFQISVFLIEELKQGVLGAAERYLVIETTSDYSVKSVASVSTSNGEVFVPRYFYGEQDTMQEALPKDRTITTIYKAKPRLISAAPNDPEAQRRIAQLEEEKSYYLYKFKLPDGTSCTYDENFIPE